MLSEDQKQFFDAFGYLVLRAVFTAEEIATIKRESDEIFEEGLGIKLATGRAALQPFFERRPFMAGLAADDRIYCIGEDLLGPDFFLIGTEGNLHAGDTLWHGAGLWDETVKSVKIAFYPESLTGATGSLRVVPGSHRRNSPDLLEPLRHGSDNPDLKPFGLEQSAGTECGARASAGRSCGLHRAHFARGVRWSRRASSARDQLHGEPDHRVEGTGSQGLLRRVQLLAQTV